MAEVVDISLPVQSSMLSWPTGRTVAEHRVVDEGDGASPRNSEWHLDSHAGTHVDAPLHWIPGGATTDRLPADAFLGPCQVVAVGEDREIAPSDLPDPVGERLLIRTPNSDGRIRSREFDPGFAAIGVDAARTIAAAGTRLVGIDYLSVESPGGGGEVHRTLLGGGVALLEGIDLSGVEPGDWNLSALPIRLVGGEASPARAVLWR